LFKVTVPNQIALYYTCGQPVESCKASNVLMGEGRLVSHGRLQDIATCILEMLGWGIKSLLELGESRIQHHPLGARPQTLVLDDHCKPV